jgi:hypothetical protein
MDTDTTTDAGGTQTNVETGSETETNAPSGGLLTTANGREGADSRTGANGARAQRAGGRPAGTPARRVPMALATWVVIALVLMVVVVLLVMEITQGHTTVPEPPVVPAADSIVHDATTIPAAVFNAVGAPGPPVLDPPVILRGESELRIGGRPAVVYIGAEFCPYCAAERWPLVVALGRFGTFSKLGATSSSLYEVFPNVKTFTFDGSIYRSRWVTFSAVEEFGPIPSDNAPAAFGFLHRPSALDQQLLRRFDVGTVVSDPGALPFVDVGNIAIAAGSEVGFSPSVLEGLSMGQIVDDLKQPSSDVAQAVVGAANALTAAICVATGDNPTSVCFSPGVRRSATQLGLGP